MRGDKYVTVIIDPALIRTTPVRSGCWTWSRSARSRRSRPCCLSARPAWREGVKVVAMDGSTGFKTATALGVTPPCEAELPDALAVMDPFYAGSSN